MERYADVDGDSSVVAYECGSDSIVIEFRDGAQYLYNYASCGASACEQMKQLAKTGEGLNSFIMRYVRKLYAARLR